MVNEAYKSVLHLSAEGQQNAFLNRASTGISNALNPVRGVRDAMRRRGIEPKNHHKENLKKMRQKQKEIKERQETQAPLLKRRFPKVKSKFLEQADLAARRVSKHTFLRRSASKPGTPACLAPPSDRPARRSSYPTRTSRLSKPAVPTQSELRKEREFPENPALQAAVEAKDFVAMNKKNAKEALPQWSTKEEKNFLKKRDYGKVPDYLVKRRLAEAERKAEMKLMAEREQIPEGMKKMPEEERLRTLNLLNNNCAQLVDAISKLPLTSDTLKKRQREQELREKLAEVEDAQKIFRKKVVFVVDE